MGAAARTIEFSDWTSNSPFEVFDKIKSDFLFDELLFFQQQKTWRKQYQLLHQSTVVFPPQHQGFAIQSTEQVKVEIKIEMNKGN